MNKEEQENKLQVAEATINSQLAQIKAQEILIDRLQKENEELKKKRNLDNELLKNIVKQEKRFVSKDKIKDKIKEFEELFDKNEKEITILVKKMCKKYQILVKKM